MFGPATRKDARVIYLSAKVVLSEVLIVRRSGLPVAGRANERSWNETRVAPHAPWHLINVSHE